MLKDGKARTSGPTLVMEMLKTTLSGLVRRGELSKNRYYSSTLLLSGYVYSYTKPELEIKRGLGELRSENNANLSTFTESLFGTIVDMFEKCWEAWIYSIRHLQ